MSNFQKNVFIREANSDGISEILKIHRRCVREVNSQFYKKDVIQEWLGQITPQNIKEQFQNSQWYVIGIEKEIIGFCQFSIEEGSLFQINISPEWQNKGYGKLLYDFIEKQFIKNGKNKISLNATLNAENFYQKLGFNQQAEIKFKLDKTFVEMIKMEKEFVM